MSIAEKLESEIPAPEIKLVPRPVAVSLADLQPELPGSELLKDNFLCRKGYLLLAGQTGKGKSSILMQMVILWAIGRDCFGIRAAAPLKILIIQAENDNDDLLEMRDGVLHYLNLSDAEKNNALKNVVVYRTSLCGAPFFAELDMLLQDYAPDFLAVDPALAYLGGENNSQKDVGEFARNQIMPRLTKYECGGIILTHMNKPKLGELGGDSAYAAAGSAEWMNAARAVINLSQDGELFTLTASKRGKRLGWLDFNGKPTDKRTIAQSDEIGMICGKVQPIIYWREPDGTQSQSPGAGNKPPKQSAKQIEKESRLRVELMALADNTYGRTEWLEKVDFPKTTFDRDLLDLTEQEKVLFENGKYRKNPNPPICTGTIKIRVKGATVPQVPQVPNE